MVTIDAQLRLLLSHEVLGELDATLARSADCMICQAPLPSDPGEVVCVLALRERGSGRKLLRFAHETCSPSRLINVERLPGEVRETPPSAPAGVELAWALAVRRGALPSVVLAWDAAQITQLEVTGGVLVESLRLEGMSGGRPIEQIRPPRVDSLSVTRSGTMLVVATIHGQERLALGDLQTARVALQLAAHQRELMVVVGERLALGRFDLEEADRMLRFGEAFAARAVYHDDELAGLPLRPSRRRCAGRMLLGMTPSKRRTRRLHSQPGS
jgi:hypothetical protein